MPDSKTCTRCNVEKPFSEFQACKNGKYGPSPGMADDSFLEEFIEASLSSAREMFKRNELEQGIAELKKTLPLAKESKNDLLLTTIYLQLGVGYLLLGDVTPAHETIDK